MTAQSGKQLSGGFQRAVIFELNGSGLPAAPGSGAYEGLEIIGPKVFDLTVPDVFRIQHVGNDRVLATQFLPPREGLTGQLRVDSSDQAVNAAMTGVEEYDIAEAAFMSWGTDQQGNEPNVGMLLVQASLDAASKLGTRKFYIIPSGRAIPTPASMNDSAAEVLYNIALNPTTRHLWGTTYVVGTEGAAEAALDEGHAEFRPNIVAFKGNGATTVFLLPTDKPSRSTAKMKAWKDGVLQSPTFTTTQMTLSPAPASNTIIVLYYEY